jgi:hypothetical protein
MTGDMTQRQTAVETVVKPLADSLVRLETQIRDLESARQRAFGGIEQQLQNLVQTELGLQKETASLVTALRAPQVRGRWGEITLRRVAELAGMVDRCDFMEQETHETETGRIRPDMIVKLPDGRIIVVDAKVPLTAYLDAVAATSEADRKNALMRHSQQVAKHVDQLSNKTYWQQFQPAPEFVILFLPGDHFFSAALEYKPALVEDAARLKILIATPATFIAILKGVAYGWRGSNSPRTPNRSANWPPNCSTASSICRRTSTILAVRWGSRSSRITSAWGRLNRASIRRCGAFANWAPPPPKSRPRRSASMWCRARPTCLNRLKLPNCLNHLKLKSGARSPSLPFTPQVTAPVVGNLGARPPSGGAIRGRRYLADALEAGRRINREGISLTLDHLGERRRHPEAEASRDVYLRAG